MCTLWSHFLFHIRSCKSWKHLFIITRQTLLESVRLCLAVELDFPACKAGMDKHWLHNASWRECSVSGFLLLVSAGPLSAHWGAAAELERLARLLCPQERLHREEKLCHKRCDNETRRLVQPPPECSRLPFPSVHFWCAPTPWPRDYKTIHKTVDLQDNIPPPA